MWSAAVGGHVHRKNRLVSSRKHRAMEVRKLRFLSSCQYTHGCYAGADEGGGGGGGGGGGALGAEAPPPPPPSYLGLS